MSSEDEEPLPAEPVVAGGRMPASPLFRPSNLRCVNTLSGHHSGIRAIAWRSNPQRVYTGSYDNTIKVWNLDTNTCETTLEGHQAWVRSLFCSLHEPLLFSGSDDGEVKIWRTDNNTLHTGIEPSGAGGVLALTVDYERAWLLAGCYDSSIHVWQLPSCELLHVLHGHRSAVKALEIFNGCLLSGRCAYGEHTIAFFLFSSLSALSHTILFFAQTATIARSNFGTSPTSANASARSGRAAPSGR